MSGENTFGGFRPEQVVNTKTALEDLTSERDALADQIERFTPDPENPNDNATLEEMRSRLDDLEDQMVALEAEAESE